MYNYITKADNNNYLCWEHLNLLKTPNENNEIQKSKTFVMLCTTRSHVKKTVSVESNRQHFSFYSSTKPLQWYFWRKFCGIPRKKDEQKGSSIKVSRPRYMRYGRQKHRAQRLYFVLTHVPQLGRKRFLDENFVAVFYILRKWLLKWEKSEGDEEKLLFHQWKWRREFKEPSEVLYFLSEVNH